MNPPSDSKDRIAGLYNRVASRYGQVGPRIFERLGKRLVELIHPSRSFPILDVASGRGASLFAVAQFIQPQGLAIGIDLASEMLTETRSEAKRKGIKNIHLLLMDGENLAFRSNTFQAVLCGFAIFFFQHPQQAIEEWYRVLTPSGRVGICLAGRGDQRWRWYEELLFDYQSRYQFSLSPVDSGLDKSEAIAELLLKEGFVDVSTVNEEYQFAYSDQEEWWQAKWTHGARFPLEQMSEEVLTSFQAEVFQRLDAHQRVSGLQEKWQAIYILGKKQ